MYRKLSQANLISINIKIGDIKYDVKFCETIKIGLCNCLIGNISLYDDRMCNFQSKPGNAIGKNTSLTC